MNRTGDWIMTYTGVHFWPLDPRPEEVNIKDIAHALANQCRWSGHVEDFYFVAEHSIRVARIVPEIDKLWGLLHDASEAYLVDLPRPLKHLPSFTAYREIEKGVMDAVCDRFGLTKSMPEVVRISDGILLATEARDLMPNWSVMSLEEQPLPHSIHYTMCPDQAERVFLACCRDLGIVP